MIKAILLVNNDVIISHTVAKTDEDNEPYFSLMYPYLLTVYPTSPKFTLTPWLEAFKASVDEFVVYPDKIITMLEPRKDISEHYRKLVLFNDSENISEDNVESKKIKTKKIKVVSPPEVAEVPNSEIDEIYGGENS